MAATPADIAKYTSDGIVITVSDQAIKDAHQEADDLAGDIIDMFFDVAAHASAVLTERFAILSQVNGPHEAVVVDESLGLGSTIPLAPSTPCFRAIDDSRSLDRTLRTRAYAYEAGSDKFSIELVL